ncbi:tRNA1(Val) A37 N6-methylase TrmN6 [Clostridium beijerinckii]|uniref:Eco57I restriction-modification methylase domain-containing protein n=1 Tax=Clostridium beijerinckii TaxID=1520 RepID=UPI001494E5A1|nr:N-6 DNA methylase [Clostridium beijerinckii]NOW93122.1 tRNA1(Val) A37 N6-methylase TrmN6 [Clostridium beijerinckii]
MNKKCQVFTPSSNVIELLDRVGYVENLYGRKVLENSCGNGNILIIIVKRYIEDCLKNNISNENIKLGLESDIYGAEIDQIHYLTCIKNLDIVANQYSIYNVSWNIYNVDILKNELTLKFDYVIGNPPYITYRDLENETRKFIREKYEVCYEGKFDYCYAFIEESLRCLNENGKLAYLIPNSIFKNVFARKLRNYILPTICKIYDYTTSKLFNGAITSSAIIICDKGNKTSHIEYCDVINNKTYYIHKSTLEEKWIFHKKDIDYKNKTLKFGDYFNASASVATLSNNVFVIKEYEDLNEYISTNGFKIEKTILKNAASPKGRAYRIKEKIIYPYYYKKNELKRYSEEEILSRFPQTLIYLQNHLNKLEKRDSENSVKWYEYGRSQALVHLNQAKLLTSTVVTNKVKIYKLTKNDIPYSGIYITAKKDIPLDYAKIILESSDFLDYVKRIGINASGNSIRITVKDINNYLFTL